MKRILDWIMNIWYWWVKLVHAYLLSWDWFFFFYRKDMYHRSFLYFSLEDIVTSNIEIGNCNRYLIFDYLLFTSEGLNHLVTLPVFVQCCQPFSVLRKGWIIDSQIELRITKWRSVVFTEFWLHFSLFLTE